MALFRFVESILKNEPIPVYGNGEQTRDFTYIDDIVEGVLRTLDTPATGDANWNPESPDPGTSSAPWGVQHWRRSTRSVAQIHFLHRNRLGQKAVMDFLPMQPGDVRHTEADVHGLSRPWDTRHQRPLMRAFLALSTGTEPITKRDSAALARTTGHRS